MSGFSSGWLALREPADLAARDTVLLCAAQGHAAAQPERTVVDLGCGTGSTFRAFDLPAAQWRLVDHDTALLAEAHARTGAKTLVADLRQIAPEVLAGAGLVTASALIDLVSRAWLEEFVARLAEGGIALYAALNYDGRMAWDAPHPLDGAVTEAFNRHQRGDKGFGQALGPDCCTALPEILRAAGYTVDDAPSDWRLGPDEAALQRELLTGIAGAARETGLLDARALEDWLAARLDAAAMGGCLVGHRDILALLRL